MIISPTLDSILLFGILYNSNPTNTQIININTWQLQDRWKKTIHNQREIIEIDSYCASCVEPQNRVSGSDSHSGL
jgi:hypothetical protein